MSYTLPYNEPESTPEQDSGPILAIHVCDLYELKTTLIEEILEGPIVHIDYATCLEYMMRDYTGYLVNLFSYTEDVAFFMMKDLPVLHYQVNSVYLDCSVFKPIIVSYMVQAYSYLRSVVGVVPGLEYIYKMHDYIDGHFTITVQQRIPQ